MNKWQLEKRIAEVQDRIYELEQKLLSADSETARRTIRNAIAQQEAALGYLIRKMKDEEHIIRRP